VFILGQLFSSSSFGSLNTVSHLTKGFTYSPALFGNSSLIISVTALNSSSGQVTLTGGDMHQPPRILTAPFTFDWNDGNITSGWVPQSHTYSDKTKNYIVSVTAHYENDQTDTYQLQVRFVSPTVTQMQLPSNLSVTIPSTTVNLTSRIPNHPWLPSGLTYFDDSFFSSVNRSLVEYVLTAVASIQYDFVNYNVSVVHDGFRQILMRDSTPGAGYAYALWYTDPVCFVAADVFLKNNMQWPAFFHEMGHDFTLSTPANYTIGDKTDGNANAIYSETMANIFSLSACYELINNAATYGLDGALTFELEQSATLAMQGVKSSYDNFVSSGRTYESWNDPTTSTDETYNTFMTLVYEFFVHEENAGLGCQVPLKRMMTFLQTFNSNDTANYSGNENTPSAEKFRSTLMVAALSCAFGQDLRAEFGNLNFPIDDKTFTEMTQRTGLQPLPSPTPGPVIPEYSYTEVAATLTVLFASALGVLFAQMSFLKRTKKTNS
jgi:hypothetical protein